MKITLEKPKIASATLELTGSEFFQLAAMVGASPAPEFGHALWHFFHEACPNIGGEKEYSNACEEIIKIRKHYS